MRTPWRKCAGTSALITGLFVIWQGMSPAVAAGMPEEVPDAAQAAPRAGAAPTPRPTAPAAGAAVSRAIADVVARYAPGSISSVPQADTALGEVRAQRAQVEAQYVRDRQACNPAFFMARCLDAAHEQHRIWLSQLHLIEIEAEAVKRRERVAARDRALAEKNDKRDHADANAMAAPAHSPEAPAAAPQQAPGTPPRAVHQPATPHAPRAPHATARPHVAKPLTPGIDAATEAANMNAYDRKAAESLRRQREVADKKAEKARDQEKKKTAAEAKGGS